MLASLKQELGDLDRVTAWVKVLGFVKCAEDFNVTPAAINGFSELILELWGDAGRHARSAIGAGELPFGMPVEVEAVVAIA
jgi:enamine deaminase RidA (YjgF/YER057c/UK114 family)